MKLTEAIINVRDITGDTSGGKWDKHFVARFLDNGVRDMFRWQVDADPSYHNTEYALDDANARQVYADIWEYDIPIWIYRISNFRVKSATTTDAVGETVFSGELRSKRPGFYLKHRTLMHVKGTTEAKDYTLDVAKIPARLQEGTTPADAPTTTTLLFANIAASFQSATAYPQEQDDGWYINSIVEMTGIDANAHEVVGQARRCTASTRVEDASTGTFRQQLTFDATWSEDPNNLDTYEMHPEVKDADLRLLFLLAANQCYIQRNDMVGKEMIGGEIAREKDRFISSVRPVQDLEPAFWTDGSELHLGNDLDRDRLLGLYPTGLF